ncbi:Trp biosynthesis-associated membrane protein [Nocardioides sp. GY 10127]|uniref:Trp biosynthesis-associated membrane protein n=1 Tax=Nocardioides sp. GY 10127 TaxID=2569762 RepID=UPI0010A884F6|nr:Trp biosynthesis-associated membrane protein [Nocardioides sp. GY 10127]TIC81010.1 hypothetical protein E8D37_14400 [Nocardioides sp. GY 10127]
MPEAAPVDGKERRRGSRMGAVLVLALASGALAAVAGGKPAASASADGTGGTVAEMTLTTGDALTLPAVTSTALVALAAIGVVLVTRGRVRRGVAVLGLLASLASVAAAVQGWWGVRSTIADTLASVGADGSTSPTAWYFAAVLGALVLVVAMAATVVLVPRWPEMGSRYDAPAGAASAAAASAAAARVGADGVTSTDLWKAMDAGLDPTGEADEPDRDTADDTADHPERDPEAADHLD